MGNPLDDALNQLDASQAWRRQQEAETERQNAEQRRKFQELVDDFVRRMNAAGNPGTDWEMKAGMFKKVKGWSLTYDVGDSWLRVPVRVDGLVPGGAGGDYVRPIDSKYTMAGKQFGTLAASMAEVMKRHGVS